MKTTILFLLALCTLTSYSQTVFSESFDEADDAITGSDAIGPATWTTTCPGSVAATDYFKVLSNRLEARDTNGPAATWTTGDIDISSCTGLDISFVMTELSDMEACVDCPGLSGLTCIDWVKLEYNLDGGGWTEVAGITCALTESPGEMIQIGNIALGGPLDYTSPCIDFGTTLQLRISCMCWAGAEVWRFDDIIVACNDCILPVDIVAYKAEQTSNGMQINWTTLAERSNDYFLLERSYDGSNFEKVQTVAGAGNSSATINYSITDDNVELGKTVYYKLTQFDFDGKSNFSEIISVESQQAVAVYYGYNELHYTINAKGYKRMNIYNVNGQLIHEEIVNGTGAIPWNKSGFFIIEFPELNLHQKLVTP
ncbi:MAG: hypothetical protein GQ574_12045 [Crocinitomix sp.]|nr:hypothetical protein [Crocinitomix sp.]